MTEELDSAKIARIDERTANITKTMFDHVNDDNARFERVFSYIKGEFGDIKGSISKMDTKIDVLWDQNNHRKGAFDLGKLIAGGLGGLIVVIMQWVNK